MPEARTYDPAVNARTAFERRSAILILDVREPYEWQAGRIEGAVHIPLGDLEARRSELDQEATVLCVCRVGGRSAVATEYLKHMGYAAENLEGGVLAWQAEGLPLTTPDGRPGTVALH